MTASCKCGKITMSSGLGIKIRVTYCYYCGKQGRR